MARYVLSTAPALLLVLLLLLAAGGRQPHVAVLEGNYDFARGDLVRALRHYRGAAHAGSPVVAYNLANAELAWGETDAGLELLRSIPADAPADLRRRVAFNLGHAHYRAGRYREAARHFRDALVLGPEWADARIKPGIGTAADARRAAAARTCVRWAAGRRGRLGTAGAVARTAGCRPGIAGRRHGRLLTPIWLYDGAGGMLISTASPAARAEPDARRAGLDAAGHGIARG